MKSPLTSHRFFWMIPASLLLLLLIIRLQAIHYRLFAGDEWQHLHMAWLISQGNIPYVDFYEHHTPLLHYMISPFFTLLPESITPLFASRWFIFSLAIGTSAALYRVVRLYHERSVAIVAVMLLNLTVGFTRHSLEVRPDVLLMFLEILIFGCIAHSLQLKGNRWIMAAGLLLGLSFLATPKAVFLCMSFGMVFLFGLFVKTDISRKAIWVNIFQLSATFFMPLLICMLYFSFIDKEGLRLFISQIIIDNFTLDIQGGAKNMWPWMGLSSSLSHNFLIWSTAAAGIGIAAFEWWRSKNRKIAEAAPLISTIMLFLSLFIVPISRPYFFLILYPFLAWYAAIILVRLDQRLIKGWHRALLLVFIIIGTASPLTTIAGETGYWHEEVINTATVKTGSLHKERPLWSRLIWENTRYVRSNREQIMDLTWILENTSPSETVFDLTSLSVMRPDTGWFWGRMYASNTNLIQSITDSNCRVVIYDKMGFKNSERLPIKVKAFIKRHYLPLKEHPKIWVSGVNVSPEDYKSIEKKADRQKVAVDLATTDDYRIRSEDPKCRVSGQKAGSSLWLEKGKNRLKVKNCPSGFSLISVSRVGKTKD